MKKVTTGAVALMMLVSGSVMAMDKTATGAVLGATAGAIAGKDVKSAAGGAIIGAGTGAMLKKGDKGKAARKGGVAGASWAQAWRRQPGRAS